MSEFKNFSELLKESEVYKLAEIIPVFGEIAQFIIDQLNDDDATVIINRINRLEHTIRSGLDRIGLLINKQTERVILEIDTQALQQAIAKALASVRQLYEYKLYNRDVDLTSSGALSSEAIEFFKQKDDPFYIGGVLISGTARLEWMRARDPFYFNNSVRVEEINQQCNCLATIINKARQNVVDSHSISSTPSSGGVGSVSHMSKGVAMSTYTFGRSNPRNPDFDPDIDFGNKAQAEHRANIDRIAGISEELEYLSIPRAEAVLALWRDASRSRIIAIETVGQLFDLNQLERADPS